MQRLGKGLKDLPRDQIVLGTKVGRYGPNAFANLFDFSAERIQGDILLPACLTTCLLVFYSDVLDKGNGLKQCANGTTDVLATTTV